MAEGQHKDTQQEGEKGEVFEDKKRTHPRAIPFSVIAHCWGTSFPWRSPGRGRARRYCLYARNARCAGTVTVATNYPQPTRHDDLVGRRLPAPGRLQHANPLASAVAFNLQKSFGPSILPKPPTNPHARNPLHCHCTLFGPSFS